MFRPASIEAAFSWIKPYCSRRKNGLAAVVAETCESEELRLLARYHFVQTRREFQNAIQRDCSIPSGLDQSNYLGRRWEKFYGREFREKGAELNLLIKRDGSHCQYCLRAKCKLEIHHVIPQHGKGPDSPFNLVLACPKCNKQISATISVPGNWWKLHPESAFRGLAIESIR
jgi:hypothetical protein